jgi:hypothetical protein
MKTLCLALLLACGCSDPYVVFDPGGEGGHGGGFEGGGEGGTPVAEGGGGMGGGGQGGEGGSACPAQRFELPVVADTGILSDACHGANYWGGQPFVNIGLGRGLFRFELDEALATALAEGRVTELALVLHRDVDCLGPGEVCPASSGALAAHPMRSDWAEGPEAFASYQGADWCRRGDAAGVDWEQPGAAGPGDSGPAGPAVAVDVEVGVVTLALEPEPHRAFVAGTSLSVMVEPLDGATFIAAAREQAEALEPAALLTGAYCQR